MLQPRLAHRSLVYLRKWCNKMSSKAVYNSLQEMHVVISASELLHKEDIKSILIGYFHLRGCFFTNNFHRCRLESSGQLFNFFKIIFKSKKKTERIFFPARVTSVFLLEIFIFLSYLWLTSPPVRPQERSGSPLDPVGPCRPTP